MRKKASTKIKFDPFLNTLRDPDNPDRIFGYLEWWERRGHSRGKISSLAPDQHEYFNVIDSEEKAYFLGLLSADGWVGHKEGVNEITFGLQDCDKYIVDRYAEIFGRTVSRRFIGQKHNRKPFHRVSFCSKYMCLVLSYKGFTHKKSYTLDAEVFKHVPKDMLHHFIRGYFDGDGCIYKGEYDGKQSNYLGFVGTYDFLKELQGVFFTFCGLPDKKLYHNTGPCYTLNYSGFPSIDAVMSWLYKDASIFLIRKHNIFTAIKEARLAKTSKFRGVCFDKSKDRWRAALTFKGKKYSLGRHKTQKAAARAYDKKAKNLGVPRYKWNFPDL